MKRARIALRGLAFCGFAIGALGAAMILGIIALSPLTYVMLAVLGLGGIVFGTIGVRSRAEQQDQESFLASYNRAFRLFPVSGLVLGCISARQLWWSWERPDDKIRLVLTVSICLSSFAITWMYALILSAKTDDRRFGPLVRDEFFQDNLTKARSDGFYAALVAIALCFSIGLFSTQWAVALLPLAAAASVTFAGLRFNARDKKALAGS